MGQSGGWTLYCGEKHLIVLCRVTTIASKRKCWFNLFSLSARVRKSVDTNGTSNIAFPQAAESLWTSRACHRVNHTHGSKSKKCHGTDRATQAHKRKKKKKKKKIAAHTHVLKVPASCARRHFNDTMWIAGMAAKRPAVKTAPAQQQQWKCILALDRMKCRLQSRIYSRADILKKKW